MKTLTIRNIPDRVHGALRRKAAGHGVSMEEEARRRLAEVTKERGDEVPAYDPERAAAARARLWKMFDGLADRSLVEEYIEEKRQRARKELAR